MALINTIFSGSIGLPPTIHSQMATTKDRFDSFECLCSIGKRMCDFSLPIYISKGMVEAQKKARRFDPNHAPFLVSSLRVPSVAFHMNVDATTLRCIVRFYVQHCVAAFLLHSLPCGWPQTRTPRRKAWYRFQVLKNSTYHESGGSDGRQ